MSEPAPPAGKPRTVITDIDISFGRLIVIFIKFGLAAIPAGIVVSIILMLIGLVLSAIFGTGFVTIMGHGIAI